MEEVGWLPKQTDKQLPQIPAVSRETSWQLWQAREGSGVLDWTVERAGPRRASRVSRMVRSLQVARRRQWRGGSRSVVPRGTSWLCHNPPGVWVAFPAVRLNSGRNGARARRQRDGGRHPQKVGATSRDEILDPSFHVERHGNDGTMPAQI
jgi:hypothetical protein